MVEHNVQVLIPLADVDISGCWDKGWRGKVFYVPIQDYGTLPPDILLDYATRIADAVKAGVSVGMFCFGGHGRTGYLAAAVLSILQPELDPIRTVRYLYCRQAIECDAQVWSLIEMTGREDLRRHLWSGYQTVVNKPRKGEKKKRKKKRGGRKWRRLRRTLARRQGQSTTR